MPTGNSYMSQYIKDAGGKYLWENNISDQVLSLDFESVYLKAAQADIWFISSPYFSDKKSLLKADKRYGYFKAFDNYLYNYQNNKQSHFYEDGILNPDIILKDIAKIIRPYLFPKHELIYYRKINE